MRVDGELIIGAWRDQAATTYTATRDLSGEHTVTMEYYENGGQAVAQLDWTLLTSRLQLDGVDVGTPGVATSIACLAFAANPSRIITPAFAHWWVALCEATRATISPSPLSGHDV